MPQDSTAFEFLSRRSVFLPEWSVVVALVATDAIWARLAGISFSIAIGAIALPVVELALALGLRRSGRFEGGALIFEYVALMTTAMQGVAVLTYLCAAAAGPLADTQLLDLDRAMGFDWLYWFDALKARPLLYDTLEGVYHTLIYQALFYAVLFGILHRRARLREMFWIVIVACLITAAGSALVPALGAFKVFSLERMGDFIPVMEKLRAGGELHFVVGRLTGIVTFPSFHTAMALVYPYGFRGTGVVGRAVLAFNLVMVVSIPFFGGHYIVDVLAGALVAGVAILLVRCGRQSTRSIRNVIGTKPSAS